MSTKVPKREETSTHRLYISLLQWEWFISVVSGKRRPDFIRYYPTCLNNTMYSSFTQYFNMVLFSTKFPFYQTDGLNVAVDKLFGQRNFVSGSTMTKICTNPILITAHTLAGGNTSLPFYFFVVFIFFFFFLYFYYYFFFFFIFFFFFFFFFF